MKKLFFLFIFFSIHFLHAQQMDNQFAESELNNNIYNENLQTEVNNTDNNNGTRIGNMPGDDDPTESVAVEPVPIDDHLPVLFLAALGMIIYAKKIRRKKNVDHKV